MTRRGFVMSTIAATVALVLAVWASRRRSGIGRPMMDARPFSPLAKRRAIGNTDLPSALARFYEKNEGVGLESTPDRIVRLCLASEVKKVTWGDIRFGAEDEPGWKDFEGFRIGLSPFHDAIYWVRRAPVCAEGSILTLGSDVAGPGGTGSEAMEPSLVLGSSFDAWLAHLAQHAWFEYGLAPGDIENLPLADQAAVRAYFKALNPSISWGAN